MLYLEGEGRFYSKPFSIFEWVWLIRLAHYGRHRHLEPMEMRQGVKTFQLGKKSVRTSLNQTGAATGLPGTMKEVEDGQMHGVNEGKA